MGFYHDIRGFTSNSAKKSMIFTEYCRSKAIQISLFNRKFEKAWLSAFREFDSCIIKKVLAGLIKPVLFLSNFSFYYLVIFSDIWYNYE